MKTETSIEPQYTPTPWKVIDRMIQGCDGEFVTHANGACEKEVETANRKFIVRAVNCHEELVEALKTLIEGAKWVGSDNNTIKDKFLEVARNAITKASGQ